VGTRTVFPPTVFFFPQSLMKSIPRHLIWHKPGLMIQPRPNHIHVFAVDLVLFLARLFVAIGCSFVVE